MSKDTFKLIEIVGTSPDSIDQAVRNGVERAAKSLRGLGWFQVSEIRVGISGDKVESFQVIMKVGVKLE